MIKKYANPVSQSLSSEDLNLLSSKILHQFTTIAKFWPMCKALVEKCSPKQVFIKSLFSTSTCLVSPYKKSFFGTCKLTLSDLEFFIGICI